MQTYLGVNPNLLGASAPFHAQLPGSNTDELALEVNILRHFGAGDERGTMAPLPCSLITVLSLAETSAQPVALKSASSSVGSSQVGSFRIEKSAVNESK